MVGSSNVEAGELDLRCFWKLCPDLKDMFAAELQEGVKVRF